MNDKQVMERLVLHSGKVFIRENEEHGRAYVIQTGKIRAFRMHEGKKIIIHEFGPNAIIGEANLFEDRVSDKSYEAVCDTAVITITKQDFQKRLQKSDSILQTVFQHMMVKISTLALESEKNTLRALDVDEGAFQIVRDLTKSVSEDQKRKYELAILPHINALVKSMHKLKAEQLNGGQ